MCLYNSIQIHPNYPQPTVVFKLVAEYNGALWPLRQRDRHKDNPFKMMSMACAYSTGFSAFLHVEDAIELAVLLINDIELMKLLPATSIILYECDPEDSCITIGYMPTTQDDILNENNTAFYSNKEHNAITIRRMHLTTVLAKFVPDEKSDENLIEISQKIGA